MFPRQPRGKAAAVVAMSTAAIASFAFSPTQVAANPLSGVSGITSIVSELPLASALPTGLAPMGGTADSVVMDVDGEERELETQMVSVTPQSADATRMSALPALPLADLPTSLPAAPISPDALGLSDDSMGKVAWILEQTSELNSPTDPVKALPGGELVDEVANGVDWNIGGLQQQDIEGITRQQAVAATQAAVWHYTTGADLVKKRNAAPVNALYDQLTGPANVGSALPTNLPLATGPGAGVPNLPGLSNVEQNLSGVEGISKQLIGPFEVAQDLESLDVDMAGFPNGASLVTEDGQSVNHMRAGERYYVAVPKSADPGQAVMQLVSDPSSLTGTLLSEVDGSGMLTNPLVITSGDQMPLRQSKAIAWGTDEFVPGAGISPTCTDKGIGVNLDNTARDEPLMVSVAGKDVSVPAGEVDVVEVKTAEGEKYDIEVKHEGRSVHLAGTKACEVQTVSNDQSTREETQTERNGPMPLTGVAIGGIVVAGAALLAGGVTFYVIARRRKSVLA